MLRICQILFVVAETSVSGGCFPIYANVNAVPASGPARFVDATSGRTVSEVLVIPRYSSVHGVALAGAGHGPSAMTSEVYVANSFRYREGDPFTPAAPKTLVLGSLLAVWILSNPTLDGVYVVAPGYEPIWVGDLSREDNRRWELSPLSPSDNRRELARIRESLREDHGHWSLGNDSNLEVRLSHSERQEAIAFLDDAIAGPGTSDPSTQKAGGP